MEIGQIPLKPSQHDLTTVKPQTYRATPLSSNKILVIVFILAVFSFIYLVYAQHHSLLFYIMTSLIALWIAFIYTAGILAVLYMVWFDYKGKETSSTDTTQESVI